MEKAGRREWLALTVIVLACVLVAMDISVLFYAAPFLTVELAPSAAELLWIMDSYGFLLAGLLITMGALGDRYGRRRVLLLGAAGFGLASVLAAFATSPEMLIAARALLGVAGATVAPSTLSLIRNIFVNDGQRRAAIGIWTAGFAAGALIGPVVAGVLLSHFWWGSVFLINVPVMVVLLVVGPRLLPEFRNPAGGRFDLLGAGLSLAAVLPVVYGGKKLAEQDASVLAVGSIVAGVAFGMLFVRRLRASAAPLIDLSLFRSRKFSAAVAVNTLLQFAMLGVLLITSQYLLVVLDISPFAASMWRLPAIATLFLGLVACGILVKKVQPASVVGLGLGIATAGFLTLALVTESTGLAVIVLGGSVMTLGVGMVVPLATDLMLATAPPERAGAAAGLAETSNEFGGALGIAILGSALTSIYRGGLDLPAGLPGDAQEAALRTVAEAQDVAAAVSSPELAAAAADAFTVGVRWTSLVGALVLAVVGAAAAVLLRRRTPAPEAVTVPA